MSEAVHDTGDRLHYFAVEATIDVATGSLSFSLVEQGTFDLDKPIWNPSLDEWGPVTSDLQGADVLLRKRLERALTAATTEGVG